MELKDALQVARYWCGEQMDSPPTGGITTAFERLVQEIERLQQERQHDAAPRTE